jgi:protein-tyrosine phosphatase
MRLGVSISPQADTYRKKALALIAAHEVWVPGSLRKVKATDRRRMGMDITWVSDRIAVGGGIWNAENMAAVAREGITHIIDMQIEFDDTPLARACGISVCWNPVDDDFERKPAEVFARGVDFALAALEDDEAKIFIHCAAGVHRAPMMTLALLGVMGWEMENAMELIAGRRPVADFAEVYVKSVEDFLKARR